MPNTRVKSCQNCRLAKARCSLTLPCARCSDRCLDCRYSAAAAAAPKNDVRPTSRRRLRPLRPADTAWDGHGLRDGHDGGGAPAAANRDHSSGASVSSVPSSITMPGGTPPTEPGIPRRPCPVSEMHTVDSPLAADPVIQDTAAWSMPEYPYQFYVPHTPTELNLIDKTLGQSLSQRCRTISQGSLTAKILLGQITEYPRMMISGHQLPPFIYPPCAVGRNSECPAEDAHECLPEPLAICASLVQMFYSRTRTTNAFVWQQIYAHARQSSSNHESQDCSTLLQYLQATMVYCLLQSQDAESRVENDTSELVSITEKLARRLFTTCASGLDAETLGITRKSWILIESLRRIGSLLYILDSLFHLDIQTPSKGTCPEVIPLPLPCDRELWEYIPDKEWEKRYQLHVAAKKKRGSRGVTVGDLLLLQYSVRQSDGSDNSNVDGLHFADELAEWCRKGDEFSAFLWMAFMMSG